MLFLDFHNQTFNYLKKFLSQKQTATVDIIIIWAWGYYFKYKYFKNSYLYKCRRY